MIVINERGDVENKPTQHHHVIREELGTIWNIH